MDVSGSQDKYYDREVLYKEIWAEPMIRVATRYFVSAVALRKTCLKLKIPVPVRGYWAKVKAGIKTGRRPGLLAFPEAPKILLIQSKPPVIDGGTKHQAIIHLLPQVFERAQSLIEVESNKNMLITVAESFPVLAKTVAATKAKLIETSKSLYHERGLCYSTGSGVYEVKVSVTSIPRVICILQALVDAVQRRSMEIVIADGKSLQIRYDGVDVPFRIREKTLLVPINTKQNKYSYMTHEYKPSGIFILELTNPPYKMQGQKAWSDNNTRKIESILNVFFCGVYRYVAQFHDDKEDSRLRQIEWQAKEEIRREAARLRALDKAREEKFVQSYNDWKRYKNLSNYLELIKDRYQAETENEEYSKWIDWCERFIKSIDPLEKDAPRYTPEKTDWLGFGSFDR